MSSENYEYLARLTANSWSIEHNEHASSYVTAAKWIDMNSDMFDDTPPELLAGMRERNTIYRLQIYPDTPVGFNWYCGPTLDSVIEQARAGDLK